MLSESELKAAHELAEQHWEWLESILHKIYVDAMIHGIKHGVRDDAFALARKLNKQKDE